MDLQEQVSLLEMCIGNFNSSPSFGPLGQLRGSQNTHQASEHARRRVYYS
jgi:hypothetical protein